MHAQVHMIHRGVYTCVVLASYNCKDFPAGIDHYSSGRLLDDRATSKLTSEVAPTDQMVV